MIRTLILFLILFFLPNTSYSQVNMESSRSQKEGFHGNFQLGVNLFKGNVNVFTYSLSSKLDYRSDKDYFFLQLFHEYGEEDVKKFQNVGFSHLRWTRMWIGNVGTEVFTQSQYNEFKLLSLRQLFGLGVRLLPYVGYEKKNFIAIGLGVMSDSEKISNQNQTDHVLRATSYISINKKIRKHTLLSLVSYYQPKITLISDFRILLEGNVEFKITKTFSMLNAVIYAYDTKPPEKVLKDDVKINVLFKYAWE